VAHPVKAKANKINSLASKFFLKVIDSTVLWYFLNDGEAVLPAASELNPR
jgi:hypothetical protein